jgi:hypothetical protein
MHASGFILPRTFPTALLAIAAAIPAHLPGMTK